MSSFKKWIPVLGIVIFLFVLIGGCSRSGSLRPNQPPEITITSYGGSDSLNSNPEMFQQKIFWAAHDVDGVVKSYAYRVLDTNDNPVQTSGHFYIDDQGWVYHYKKGVTVDENTPPPNTPGYGTIWTKDVYALINFPAHNAEGDSSDVVSKFEVKCKDDRGAESNIASKYFTAYSKIPSVTFDNKEKIDHIVVGQGIYLDFGINDANIGIEGNDKADHFEYMLKKRSNLTGDYIVTPGYNQWYSVYKHNNSFYFEISKDTTPALSANSYNSIYKSFQDSTILVYRVVNLAGIESKPDSVIFASKTGFHPGSLVYESVCWALGKYHYSLVGQDNIIVPSFENASGTPYYAITPFTDLQGNKALIGSDDIKIFMHWGWQGEYSGNDPIEGSKDNIVEDEDTKTDYYSKIKEFLVRLDNKPLYLPYLLADDGDNVYTDSDGKKWLRIPSSHYNFQDAILTKTTLEYATGNLYGTHKFEVKALDIQGVVDPTPAEYIFRVDRYLPPEERSRILVLDNDKIHPKIDTLWVQLLSNHIDQADIVDITQTGYTNKISLTDYLKYKFIILYSENIIQGTDGTELKNMFQVLQMYLDFGGNVFISGGLNQKHDLNYLNDQGYGNILSTYFGIDKSVDNPIDVFKDNTGTSSSYTNLQFFNGATSIEADYPDLSFDFESASAFDARLNALNPEHALGPVSYITNPTDTATPLYNYKSIDPGDGTHQPTATQYNQLNSLVVGQKKITDSNKCYLFTFPISYMNIDQGTELMNKIINEVMGQ